MALISDLPGSHREPTLPIIPETESSFHAETQEKKTDTLLLLNLKASEPGAA
jgi:hypothetical protein